MLRHVYSLMRFALLSDTHIGRSQFKLEERELDFKKAFKNCISRIVEEKVDFVLHCGDLFDVGKPENDDIVFVIKQLQKLKVPFFIVPGSHDMTATGTVLTIFEKVGLLTNLAHPRYRVFKDDKIVIKGEVVGDVFVCGVEGRRANIKEIYSLLDFQKTKCKTKIFAFHHITSDVSTIFADIPTALLPKGFDYYCGGHWHSKSVIKHYNSKIIYPGSLENYDLREMERGESKGFFIIDLEKKEEKFIEMPVRGYKILKINIESLNPEQATQKCIAQIKPDNGKLLIIKLSGKLKSGNKGEINKLRINQDAQNKGYLFCKIIISDVLNPIEKIKVEQGNKTLEQIEKEYLMKRGYTRTQIDYAKKFMQIIGSEELTGLHLEKAQKRIIEELENEIERD